MKSKRSKEIATPAPIVNGDNDILTGADAIRRFINREILEKPISRSQPYYLIESRGVPAGKIGGLLFASKAKLRDHFALITAGGANPSTPTEAATPAQSPKRTIVRARGARQPQRSRSRSGLGPRL